LGNLSDKYQERYHENKRDVKAPIMSDKYEERYMLRSEQSLL
jgi:hypothetical protein